MNEIKTDKALYLYSELGHLNDSLTNAALTYKKRKPNRTVAVILIAASLSVTVLFCLAVGIGSLLRIGSMFKDSDNDNSLAEAQTLSELLEGYNNAEVLSSDEIDLFDGNAKLVWSFDGTDKYYSRQLSHNEISKLNDTVGTGTELSTEASLGEDCRVWLSDGNGNVMSPYLEKSVGNVGFGNLFDYNPEIEPSDSFTQSLIEILT